VRPCERGDDAIRERAADYVLGVLPASEAARFEDHVAAGCAACAGELRVAREVESALGSLAPRRDPPAGLRAALLRAIASSDSKVRQVWRDFGRGAERGDRFVVRQDEGAWHEVGIPGIQVRQLAVDPAAARVTMVIRMAPGTRYPPHRHGGREECYVLAGDLRHGDQVMTAGDFEVAEEDAIHGWQWTEGGCLLLIHGSQRDELLPA
jgi:quercetin dioxygenase-like cupin family protein